MFVWSAAIKNLRGEYYLNGHWVIEFSRATPIAGTMLYYQRGAEGDNAPETIIGRGPTTEPLVVEVKSQIVYLLFVCFVFNSKDYFNKNDISTQCPVLSMYHII